MNKPFVFNLIVFVLLAVNSFGQNKKTGFLDGYVILNSRDTVKGQVKYINAVPYMVLSDIKFKENKDAKVIEYTPNEIIGYKAGFLVFHSMSVTGLDADKEFMELIVDGYLRLYKVGRAVAGAPSFGAGGSITNVGGTTAFTYFLIKSDETRMFDVSKGKFKDSVSEYLKDNKVISEKVKKRKYTKEEIGRIAREYNKTRTIE